VARKFLYIIASLTIVVIVAMFALRIWSDDLTNLAFVPSSEFEAQDPLPEDAYADMGMWVSRPGLGESDPARWTPAGLDKNGEALGASVFFVHPTSYFEKSHWNAPLTDERANEVVRDWVRNMASPFNASADLWVPRYRQATFGTFVTGKPEAAQALDLAYGDIAMAFEVFAKTIARDRPIVLAGHSQGTFHLRKLIRDRIKGSDLEPRIAAVYLIGWPVSLSHDLPAMGMLPCEMAEQANCVVSWQSFAEPADTGQIDKAAAIRGWMDGTSGDGHPYLCSNPLTGTDGASAPASSNIGSVIPADETGALQTGMIPATCDRNGILLIGEAPEIGSFVLPGNNYHVYDIPMFWANLREDVRNRVEAWRAAR